MRREIKQLYEFDGFRLDVEKGRLTRGDETVQLPPKAIELLVLLVERRGETVEKDFLMNALWQETFVEEANLTQNVYLLRKALGKRADGRAFIETQPKRGYKFTPEVNLVPVEDDALVVSKITSIRARVTEYEEDAEKKDDAIENLPVELENPNAPRFRKAISPALLLSLTPFLLLAVGAAIYFLLWNQTETRAPVKSIAVMPFKIIGAPEREESSLGLGMADAIITRLGKTGEINVNPTDAVRRYSEKGFEPEAAARSLGAEAFLTGNIQRDGDRTRVTVQLVRVGEAKPFWADNFDEKSSDVFALQDAISARLAGALTLKLAGDEMRQNAKKRAPDAEAYNLYLEGRLFFARRTPEWIGKAIECFDRAARIDPDFAEAYAGLADAYAVTVSGLPPAERFPKAKAAALRALALDETLAEAHTSLAFILYKSEWNWLEAENHFRRAVEINPSYAQAHHWFGEMQGLRGRFDEGLNSLREAERLDPLSAAIKTDIAELLFRARRYDEAIEQARKALAIEPNFRNAHRMIARSEEQKGNFAAAAASDLETLRLSNYPAAQIEELQNVFNRAGWQAYWRKQSEIQTQQNRVEYVPSYQSIEILLRLGKRDEALKMLEKSFDERGDAALYLLTEPALDVLRSDPRFEYLKHRAGF